MMDSSRELLASQAIAVLRILHSQWNRKKVSLPAVRMECEMFVLLLARPGIESNTRNHAVMPRQ